MIQEKDFLYRVPVKTAPITTPGGQIRNPEILVDVEGGEFMRGNILDANSTNKLINQSVKDAVDNKLIEGGYVTKDLLEAETTRATEQENSLKTLIGAETSARTKGDEDLSSKIKAEQTRAEGKEKEISDKLAIVNGDSNTEGSFRKAIADVVAAAPEDLDTLKEIADKLAGNDDLHTALNQAITEKADASALLNEVSRATGVENNLKTAIDGKQPKGNYLTEHQSLEEYAKKTDIPEIDTSDFVSKTATNAQDIMSELTVRNRLYVREKSNPVYTSISYSGISVYGDLAIPCIKSDGVVVYKRNNSDEYTKLDKDFVCARDHRAEMHASATSISSWELDELEPSGLGDSLFYLDEDGVRLLNGDNNHVLTSHGSTIDITQYAKKSELPAIPTKTSQLTNDSNFITTADVDLTPYATIVNLSATESRLDTRIDNNTKAIEAKQDKGNYISYIDYNGHGYTLNGELMLGEEFSILSLSNTDITLNGPGGSGFGLSSDSIEINNGEAIVNISPVQISSTKNEINQFKITPNSIILGNEVIPIVSISRKGIKFISKTDKDIPTAGGTFISLSSLASAEDISNLQTDLSRKQDKGSYMAYSSEDDNNYYLHRGLVSSKPFVVDDSYGNEVKYGINGITATGHPDCIPTTSGTFMPLSEFVDTATYDSKIAALEARITALETKHAEATA